MSLVGNPIPPRPAYFGPDGAPPGIAVDLDAYRRWTVLGNIDRSEPWWPTRPLIAPIGAVIHTNAANQEGGLQSAINWGNASKNNTKPHYNFNAPQPTKHVPTDRRAIANSTGLVAELEYRVRDSSYWMLAFETADRGSLNGGSVDLGDFLYDHDELVARAIAYESIVHGFDIFVPTRWTDGGIVAHTAPFPYPFFTTVRGKTCPGTTKKNRVLHGDILPRAREIRDAWTGTTPTPSPGDDDMKTIDPGRWLTDVTLDADTTYEFDTPYKAVAFAGNFTVTGASGVGWLTAWGDGEPPAVSTVRILPGAGNDNHARVKAGADGKVRIRTTTACRLWVDLQGLEQ